MSDAALQVTQILDAVARGDRAATDDLLPVVYEELRRMAADQMSRERPDHTLQATALVHEAYVRLLGDNASWENRRHFFGAAAEAMRRVLVDHARSRGARRRGGDRGRIDLEAAEVTLAGDADGASLDLVLLDEALLRMAKEDPRAAEVVKLRYFAGLGIEDTAHVLGVSGMTVSRIWRSARAWLHAELCKEDRRED